MAEQMKENGVYILVQRVGEGADLSKLELVGEPGDHVTNVKSRARTTVPASISVNDGPVLGLVVRVEAVLAFRPELVLVSAASAKPSATGPNDEGPEQRSLGGAS